MNQCVIREDSGKRLLLIDDEEHVRRPQRMILEKNGYHVIEAENGRVGLESFRAHQPDLIIVDLRMPDIDGFGVLEVVVAEAPDTPVIIVSGEGVMNDAIHAMRSGAWDYLMKPTKPSMMLHTIEANLERARLVHENREFSRRLEEQLKKVNEDEEAGRIIQAKLLPPEEWHSGPYTFRQAVTPSMYLSGDFVDYFNIDGSKLGFYCADISGHGVSSALVTVFLKSFVVKFRERYRNEEDESILSPARIMEELNTELLRENLDKHLTMFYGVIDAESNVLTFSNGGHYPYPLIDSAGSVFEISERGMAVGLFPHAEYQDYQMHLPDSFRLTVFSDGVLDILPQATLEEKTAHLKEIKRNDEVQTLISKAERLDTLPDDVTVLSVEKGV